MPSEAVSEFANQSGLLANWLGERIDNINLPNADKSRLIGACLLVSLSHHVAIASLVRDDRPGSAFALLRPQIDGYLRALWLRDLANDEQISGVMHGDDPPGSKKIAGWLEEKKIFDTDSLTKIADGVWPAVCDFTHTGIRMIHSHLAENEIRPSFPDELIRDFFLHSDFWALMAAIALAELAGKQDLINEISEKAMAIAKGQGE